MPIDLSADQVRTMQIVRFFQQVGGAAPNNVAYLLGTDDAQIGYITGGTIPQSGSIDPIWSPDRREWDGDTFLRSGQVCTTLSDRSRADRR